MGVAVSLTGLRIFTTKLMMLNVRTTFNVTAVVNIYDITNQCAQYWILKVLIILVFVVSFQQQSTFSLHRDKERNFVISDQFIDFDILFELILTSVTYKSFIS